MKTVFRQKCRRYVIVWRQFDLVQRRSQITSTENVGGKTQILGFSFNENFPVVAQLSLIFGNESRELLIAHETVLIDRR